jgi:hypothetical protein
MVARMCQAPVMDTTVGTSVRVVNPDTGAEVFGPASNTTAEVQRSSDITPADHVLVKVRPSFRPGMPYDLASYPADWIKSVDA